MNITKTSMILTSIFSGSNKLIPTGKIIISVSIISITVGISGNPFKNPLFIKIPYPNHCPNFLFIFFIYFFLFVFYFIILIFFISSLYYLSNGGPPSRVVKSFPLPTGSPIPGAFGAGPGVMNMKSIITEINPIVSKMCKM